MIHLQNFILYSISVITIIIIDRRQNNIKIKLIFKTWGLLALLIISITTVQRRHANNIATIMSVLKIIKLHRIFDFLFKHFMSQLKVELIELSHFFVVFHKTQNKKLIGKLTRLKSKDKR